MEDKKYKKGISTILNNCCQWSQIFRTKNIGSMKDRFLKFKNNTDIEHTYSDWEDFIHKEIPDDKINEMTKITMALFEEVRNNMSEITEEDIKDFIKSVIYEKSYNGFMIERNILKEISDEHKFELRFSTPEEEKQGIDGWLNNKPIQVKPESYNSLNEKIVPEIKNIYTVFYKTRGNSFKYKFNEEDFEKYCKEI